MSGAGLSWVGAVAGWAAPLTIGTFVVVGAHHKRWYDAWRDTMTDLGKGTDGVAQLFWVVNFVVAVLLSVLAWAAQDVLQSWWITGALIIAAVGSAIFGITARDHGWVSHVHDLTAVVVLLDIVAAPLVTPWFDSTLQGNDLIIFRWVSMALGIAAAVVAPMAVWRIVAKKSFAGLLERLVWVAGYGWVVVLACTLVRPGWWCVLALGLWVALALRYVLRPDWRDPSPEFLLAECQPGTLAPLGNATYGLLWVGTIDKPDEFLRQLGLARKGDSPLIGTTRDGGTSAVTIAFTARGLKKLGLQYRWHAPFVEDAFGSGMLARAESLGDTGPNGPTHWDDGWSDPEKLDVAFWIQTGITDEEAEASVDEKKDEAVRAAIYAGAKDGANAELKMLDDLVTRQFPSVTERLHVDTNRLDRTSQEHFGFVDGLSQPWVDAIEKSRRGGAGGKLSVRGRWKPLALGEFVVGQVDETGDIFPVPSPPDVFLGGTFLVVRKLQQDVAGFHDYADDPNHPLGAPLIGRRRDGTPLEPVARPEKSPNDFKYGQDPDGVQCPLGAHIRRGNPRDALGLGTILTARRRIIRRGMPYGKPYSQDTPDDNDRGLLFLACNVRIAEQFEFIQKQWLNDASPFGLGDIPDPVSGLWPAGSHRPLVVTGRNPEVRTDLHSFVTTKGGEYFFAPSVSGLEKLAALGERNVEAVEQVGTPGGD